jgi:hypothetical protein
LIEVEESSAGAAVIGFGRLVLGEEHGYVRGSKAEVLSEEA